MFLKFIDPQTAVMHQVVERPRMFWSQGKLDGCLVACLEGLLGGLEEGTIPDLFFQEVRPRLH